MLLGAGTSRSRQLLQSSSTVDPSSSLASQASSLGVSLGVSSSQTSVVSSSGSAAPVSRELSAVLYSQIIGLLR